MIGGRCLEGALTAVSPGKGHGFFPRGGAKKGAKNSSISGAVGPEQRSKTGYFLSPSCMGKLFQAIIGLESRERCAMDRPFIIGTNEAGHLNTQGRKRAFAEKEPCH